MKTNASKPTEQSDQNPSKGPDSRLVHILQQQGAAALDGRHDFAHLSPEDKLRANASLVRFMRQFKGIANGSGGSGQRKAGNLKTDSEDGSNTSVNP